MKTHPRKARPGAWILRFAAASGRLPTDVPDAARLRGAHRDESGLVVVWTAMLMVVILGFTAWAVDFGNWKDRSTRLQKAADAAALAGVVFMPENVNNLAFTTARTIAAKNGYTDGQSGVTVT